MSRLLQSLLLACVIFICYGEICSEAKHKGSEDGEQFKDSIEIRPGQRLLHYVSTRCQQNGMKLVGLTVQASDYDSRPQVEFGRSYVLIIRTGHLKKAGHVEATSYCSEITV